MLLGFSSLLLSLLKKSSNLFVSFYRMFSIKLILQSSVLHNDRRTSIKLRSVIYNS